MAKPRQDRIALDDGGNKTGLVVGVTLALLAIVADGLAIYTQALPAGHRDTIATVWSLSMRQMRAVAPGALQLGGGRRGDLGGGSVGWRLGGWCWRRRPRSSLRRRGGRF